MSQSERIAILIPCLNEEKTVGNVIRSFRQAIPSAEVYVYDNGSTDRTKEIARASGAFVGEQPLRGKGNVVQKMFIEIDADIYIMADGDETYPAHEVHLLLSPLREKQADVVIGNRLKYANRENLVLLHHFGNRFLVWLLNFLYDSAYEDILSGYRVMTRDFVKGVSLSSAGFEIETELSIRAVQGSYRVVEIPVSYYARPKGSQSKLRAFHDGFRILRTMLKG